MNKWGFLVLAMILLVGCTATPEAPVEPEPVVVPEPVEVVEEPVEPEPVKAAPEVEEPEEDAVVDNNLPEGYVDLQNYKRAPVEILFDHLEEVDKENYEQTRTKKYMSLEKPYEGKAKIYYAKWVEISDEFLQKEGKMMGDVWAEANAGRIQYFEAVLHDYRGVIIANVIVKNSEVKVTMKKSSINI